MRCLGNAGGFSGAVFWRFTDEVQRDLVLRLWPTGTKVDRVRWIHSVLRHVSRQDVSIVPVPLQHRQGDSVFEVSKRLAELSPWMSGAADFTRQPTGLRLQNTMWAVARLHGALSSFESHGAGLSDGMSTRLAKFSALNNDRLDRLVRAGQQKPKHALAKFVAPLASSVRKNRSSITHRLQWGAGVVVPLQVCVRDIWHDHILFAGEDVAAIVDFDALRVDSVCLDLARLLQSMVGNNEGKWQFAVNKYGERRGLTSTELDLISVLRRVNPILSTATWLEWAFIDGHEFEDSLRIAGRLETWRRLMP